MSPNQDIQSLLAVYKRLDGPSLEKGEKMVEALRRGEKAAKEALDGIAMNIGGQWLVRETVEVVFLPGAEVHRRYHSDLAGTLDEPYSSSLPMFVRSLETVSFADLESAAKPVAGLILRGMADEEPPHFFDEIFMPWPDFRAGIHQVAVLTPQKPLEEG